MFEFMLELLPLIVPATVAAVVAAFCLLLAMTCFSRDTAVFLAGLPAGTAYVVVFLFIAGPMPIISIAMVAVLFGMIGLSTGWIAAAVWVELSENINALLSLPVAVIAAIVANIVGLYVFAVVTLQLAKLLGL